MSILFPCEIYDQIANIVKTKFIGHDDNHLRFVQNYQKA